MHVYHGLLVVWYIFFCPRVQCDGNNKNVFRRKGSGNHQAKWSNISGGKINPTACPGIKINGQLMRFLIFVAGTTDVHVP
jgi:hypothetical protein